MNAVVTITDPNEWLPLELVAVQFGCTIYNLSNHRADLSRAIRRRRAPRDDAGGVRYLYLRADVAKVARIIKSCEVSVPVACRVLAALKRNEIP